MIVKEYLGGIRSYAIQPKWAGMEQRTTWPATSLEEMKQFAQALSEYIKAYPHHVRPVLVADTEGDKARLETITRVLVANGIPVIYVEGKLEETKLRGELQGGNYSFGIYTSADGVSIWNARGRLPVQVSGTLERILAGVRHIKIWMREELPENLAGSISSQTLKREASALADKGKYLDCLLYTSPSPRDLSTSRMPSSA